MNKELIEALEECLEGVRELNGEYQEGWGNTIEKAEKALQKAKEEDKPLFGKEVQLDEKAKECIDKAFRDNLKPTSKFFKDQQPTKKDLICEAIRKGEEIEKIKELKDKDYGKNGHIETIYSRIKTELEKYSGTEIDAIRVATEKVYSESVKPLLIKLSSFDQQPTKNAEEHKSRKDFLDEASSKLSHGAITDFRDTADGYGFNDIIKVVYYAMSKYRLHIIKKYSNQSKDEIQQRDLTIQELSEQLIESNQSKWISVEDRLPEKNQDVLTFDSEGYIDVCVYEFREDGNVFMVTDTCSVLKNVTHWQPLPQPPLTNDKQ